MPPPLPPLPATRRRRSALASSSGSRRPRALIGGPAVIVADEPTSALDSGHEADFLALLFAEAERAGASVIMVSHAERLGIHFDRTVRLPEIARFGPAATAEAAA